MAGRSFPRPPGCLLKLKREPHTWGAHILMAPRHRQGRSWERGHPEAHVASMTPQGPCRVVRRFPGLIPKPKVPVTARREEDGHSEPGRFLQ